MSPDPADDATLADLLAAYDDALAGGASAADHASPWRGLDPAARERLDQNRSVLDQLERLWPRNGGSPTPRAEAAGPGPPPPIDFGRFRVRRKLGAGGCGVVFLADDPVLGRQVALKVPRPELLGSADMGRRFVREARTAALLTHPNIVPVYEAGGAGGGCYIAAEFCPGPTLAAWLARRPPPPPAAAAGLIAALADAMGYAHRRGIVHRDLKPSNVLLYITDRAAGAGGPGPPARPSPVGFQSSVADGGAEILPKVTDFGFAKLLERTDDATRTGTVIGTPQYMAPEQAEGRLAAVGPATDVYALGAVLYELLTGRPPIRGATAADTLRRVVSTDPPRPRAVRPDLPRDLEAVCLTCLAKDPAKRYPDGAALAADLGRFLAGEPTRARPPGPAERAAKWAARNPMAAALAAVVAAAVVGFAGLEAAYNRHLADQNRELENALARETAQAGEVGRQRRIADDRAAAARRQAYLAGMRHLGVLAGDGLVHELAAAWGRGPADTDADLRGFEWHYLARLARTARVWHGFPRLVDAVALSADGRRAAAHAGDEVRVWDTADDRVLARWDGLPAAGRILRFSPDGRTLAVPDGFTDPKLMTLDVGTGARRVVSDRADRTAGAAAHFLADGRLLVPTAAGLRLIDPAGGRESPELLHPGWVPFAAAASPDGAVVVAAFESKAGDAFRVVVFDPATGRGAVLPGAVQAFDRVRVSADRRYAALLENRRREISVWDLSDRTGGPVAALRFDGGPDFGEFVFRPDGRLAAAGWPDAAGDAAGEVWFGTWEPAGNRWATRRVETGCKVTSVAPAADGRRFLVGSRDRTARVIEFDPPPRVREWPAHSPAEAWAVAVSPDGSALVTGGDDAAVRVWDPRTGARLAASKANLALVATAVFAPDGKTFATGGFSGAVKLFDAATRAVVRSFPHGGKVRSVAFSPDGALLASGGNGTVVRIWEAATGRLVRELPGHERVRKVVFTGPRTLVAGDGTTLRWWDVDDGRLIRAIADANAPGGLAVTPDGRTLVVAAETGQLVFRDAATGAERYQGFGSPKRLTTVAVAPDGKTVATGGLDGAVRLWHAATGDELFPLTEPGPPVYGVAFAPDGSCLIATRHDGHVLVWPTGEK